MNKIQLQPVETAPRNNEEEILLKYSGGKHLRIGWWSHSLHGWSIHGNLLQDKYIEGWAPVPDFELPPKRKTVLEEVEENINKGRSALCVNAAVADKHHAEQEGKLRIYEILLKHKGEPIE